MSIREGCPHFNEYLRESRYSSQGKFTLESLMKISNQFHSFLLLALLLATSCRKNTDSANQANGDRNLESRNHLGQLAKLRDNSAGEKMTNSSLQDAYSVLQTKKDPKERFEGLRELLRKAAANGLYEDAIAMARNGTGKGSDRTLLFADIFESSTKPAAEIIELYRGLDDPDERMGAALGLTKPGQFSTADGKMMDIDFKKEGLSMSLAISLMQESGISFDLNVPTKLDALAAKNTLAILRDLLASGKLDKKDMEDALARIAFSDPSISFSFLAANSMGVDKSVLERIIRQQTEKNPNDTLNRLMDGSSPGLSNCIAAAFEMWLSKDNDAAQQWLEGNRTNMSETQIGECQLSQAGHFAANGSFLEGWKLVNSIADPALKKRAEGKVWSAERDSLNKAVREDPANTVQGIVSGQSKFADYWIEEAMGTWIAKDPEKAEEWYQKNWSSLPVEKAQYLAAAYANQAIKQGDAATASKWTALIQDPKTKQRILDAINKSESVVK